MSKFSHPWAYLAGLHPAAPWIVLPIVVWLLTWTIRRLWPGAWERFARLGPVSSAASKAWQAAPAALLGAALEALAGGRSPRELCLAAAVSLAAPVWHELARATTSRVDWIPTYYGGKWPAASLAPPPPLPRPPGSPLELEQPTKTDRPE